MEFEQAVERVIEATRRLVRESAGGTSDECLRVALRLWELTQELEIAKRKAESCVPTE